jgi:hypothetical protein
MPMISPFFVRLCSLVIIGLCLASCSQSYRYKLTLAVKTPDGVKRASGIVEVEFWQSERREFRSYLARIRSQLLAVRSRLQRENPTSTIAYFFSG